MSRMGDRLPANCGVRSSGSKFVLSYELRSGVVKKSIDWKWEPVEGNNYVAKFEAKTQTGDVRYHISAPIPGEIHSQLGKPDKSTSDGVFKVVLKKTSSGVPDIAKFFNVAQ